MIATIDTNVLVSGLRSSAGASHQVLLQMQAEAFVPAITPALFLEYEDVLKRPEQLKANRLTEQDIEAFVDAVAALAHRVPSIRFCWRPVAHDPGDDLVVECAAASNSLYLVTQNTRDFAPIKGQFQFEVVRPAEFLQILRS